MHFLDHTVGTKVKPIPMQQSGKTCLSDMPCPLRAFEKFVELWVDGAVPFECKEVHLALADEESVKHVEFRRALGVRSSALAVRRTVGTRWEELMSPWDGARRDARRGAQRAWVAQNTERVCRAFEHLCEAMHGRKLRFVSSDALMRFERCLHDVLWEKTCELRLVFDTAALLYSLAEWSSCVSV